MIAQQKLNAGEGDSLLQAKIAPRDSLPTTSCRKRAACARHR
jgi:hypothetical protein